MNRVRPGSINRARPGSSAEPQLAQPPEAEESCALPSSDDSQQEPDVARPNMEQCEQAGYATRSPPLPPTVLIRDQHRSTGIDPHLHTAGGIPASSVVQQQGEMP